MLTIAVPHLLQASMRRDRLCDLTFMSIERSRKLILMKL